MTDDDFARAELGAHLLVAMGMPLVSVVEAVVTWRTSTAPIPIVCEQLELDAAA